MFRFVITMLWGSMSAVLVYAANDNLFVNFTSGLILAFVLVLTLWCADRYTVSLGGVQGIKKIPLYVRLFVWFLLYEFFPGLLLCGLAAVGLFVLPYGMGTALAMCLPISLIGLRDYVDLSWLA